MTSSQEGKSWVRNFNDFLVTKYCKKSTKNMFNLKVTWKLDFTHGKAKLKIDVTLAA